MRSGRLIVALLGIPFLLVGLGVTGHMGYELWRGYAARSWTETTATIESVSLDRRTSRSGGKRKRTSTNYSASVAYRYTAGGIEREGNKATLYGGRDSDQTYHQAVVNRIESFKRQNKPMPCRVNPANPDDAVLLLDQRWGQLGIESIFSLLFTSVGLGLLLIRGDRADQRISAWEKSQHPGEPWRWRADWASGRIHASAAGFPRTLTILAIFWNTVSWTLLVLMLLDRSDLHDGGRWLLYVMPAVAVLLAAGAIYEMLNHRKFGGTLLLLDTVPARTGGSLMGRIAVPRAVVPAGGFRVTLECVRNEAYRTAKGKTAYREVSLWSDHVLVKDHLERTAAGMMVPVKIAISGGQPAAQPDVEDVGVRWRLKIEANMPGVDLMRTFDVPVFGPATPG